MALRELVTGSDACTPAEGGAGPSNAMASLADSLLGRSSKAQERLREVRSQVRDGALAPAGASRCCCRGRTAGRRRACKVAAAVASLHVLWCLLAAVPKLLADDRVSQKCRRGWSTRASACRPTRVFCAAVENRHSHAFLRGGCSNTAHALVPATCTAAVRAAARPQRRRLRAQQPGMAGAAGPSGLHEYAGGSASAAALAAAEGVGPGHEPQLGPSRGPQPGRRRGPQLGPRRGPQQCRCAVRSWRVCCTHCSDQPLARVPSKLPADSLRWDGPWRPKQCQVLLELDQCRTRRLQIVRGARRPRRARAWRRSAVRPHVHHFSCSRVFRCGRAGGGSGAGTQLPAAAATWAPASRA